MANPLGLDRQVLAGFLKNHESIKAFERVFLDVSVTLPDAIQAVELGAGVAQQQAGEALAGLAAIAQQLALMLLAPMAQLEQSDSYAPPVNYTMADSDFMPPIFPYDPSAVAITGGTIDKTIIGSRVAAAGTFSTMTTGNAVISGGTINGTTIGATSASTGKFSTLESTGLVSLNTSGNVTLIGTTFTSSGNGKLQVREAGNEFIYSAKNTASKEWVWGVNANTMYFRNATDAVNLMFFTNAGRVLIGSATDDGTTKFQVNGGGIKHADTTLIHTSVALTNGAAAAAGTITNAPTAGNPTKWVPIDDNGTTRYIPAW